MIIKSCSDKYNKYSETLIPKIEYNYNGTNKNYFIIPEYEVPDDEDDYCKSFDPFYSFKQRLRTPPIDICRSKKSH